MRIVKCATPLLLLFLVGVQASAQRSEIGFGIGTLNYTGDLTRRYNLLNSRPAATVFYRSNLSKVVSIRAGITAGNLAASDQRPIDVFSSERDASFSLFLFEASTVLEYHFLNWRDTKHFVRFSPYLFGGLGLFGMSGSANKPEEYSDIQLSIPFGSGVKYVVNPKWYVALEFGPRKTYFDYLDNISAGNPVNKNYQYGNRYDTDVYYYLGISVTRTFYDIPCPNNPYK